MLRPEREVRGGGRLQGAGRGGLLGVSSSLAIPGRSYGVCVCGFLCVFVHHTTGCPRIAISQCVAVDLLAGERAEMHFSYLMLDFFSCYCIHLSQSSTTYPSTYAVFALPFIYTQPSV